MIVYNNFEWDVREAQACLAAHGVSFKEASTVFAAEDVTISEDPASGRLRAIGLSSRGRMLVVLHQRGPRLRILGAELHTNRPAKVAAPEPAAPPPAPEPVPAPPSTVKPPAAEPESAPSSSNGAPSGTGWTAEAYEIYWEAYSAARQAARKEGKSHREAQRLGRVAGERAVADRSGASSSQAARAGA